MKTQKQIKDKIIKHILSNCEDIEMTPLELLKANIKALKYGNRTNLDAAKELVLGGSFLCYYEDANRFLFLNTNIKVNRFKDETNWQTYINLLATEIVELIKENK